MTPHTDFHRPERLHELARKVADTLADPDRKQLRFNDIVETAIRFYPTATESGVRELVNACDRAQQDLYVAKQPMWDVLNRQYGWML